MTNPEPRMEIDLHGARPEIALRKLAQALHTARFRRASHLLVITGRGLSNASQKPVLRNRVEEWLRSPEGKRAGARGSSRQAKGGALLVRLEPPRSDRA